MENGESVAVDGGNEGSEEDMGADVEVEAETTPDGAKESGLKRRRGRPRKVLPKGFRQR